MLDRPRGQLIGGSVAFLLGFTVLAALVTADRSPLDLVDGWGRTLEDWADGYPSLQQVLRWVETGFGTWAMTAYTVLLGVLLWLRRHRRAAAFVVGVMLTTSAITTTVKYFLARHRPDWQDPVGILDSKSFPSGHASSVTAFALLLALLIAMFVRRAEQRRAGYAALVLLVVGIWADRVLLGRHYPSDVLGGSVLAAGVVLAWLALSGPLPRRLTLHPDRPPTDQETDRHRLAVILNPAKVDNQVMFRQIVSSLAARSGWGEPSWHLTTIADPGAGMARAAAAEGAGLVIVCGGDGTVREVCATLAGTGIPVGIIPAGTGNLLARNLDIPLFLRAAVDVALTGVDRPIDLVEVSGDGFESTHFLVMAGLGMDAAIMAGVNEDVKKRIGWLAYVVSGLKSLASPAARIEVTLDDQPPSMHRARTIVVGNVGHLQAGMPLLPDARIDDGLLDVVVLHPERFWSWLSVVARVLTRHPRTDETINRMTGSRVRLRVDDDIPRQLDGDPIGAGRELVMTCLPGRLLVRVPGAPARDSLGE